MSLDRSFGFRMICGALMLLCFAVGIALLYAFVANTLLPFAMTQGAVGPRTDYWGYYMAAFAGCALIVWGAMLGVAIRSPQLARGIATVTAFGLVLSAAFRIIGWFSGEYAETGDLLRFEAAVMLLLALGFVWLRPSRQLVIARGYERR